MNLNVIRPKNATEYLLLFITKNCETLIDLTHARPQETLETRLTQPKQTIFLRHLLFLVLNLIGCLD